MEGKEIIERAEKYSASLNGSTLKAILPQRENAIKALKEKGFPKPKSEAYKYTNISKSFKEIFKENMASFHAGRELAEEYMEDENYTDIAELEKQGELEDVGGAYYLTGLSSEAPSSENVEYINTITTENINAGNIKL